MISSTILASLVILLPLFWLFLKARTHAKPGPSLPPGPLPLPVIGNLHMLGQLPHRALAKLALKYGPIMSLRLGHVQAIVVSSAKAAELFLKQNDAVFASRPITQASVYLTYGTKGIGFTPYGEYWRQMRKMCNLHLLSPAKVESFEGLRRREIKAGVRRLKIAAAAAEVVDLEAQVAELVEETAYKMVVGKGKEEGKRFELKEVVEEILRLAGLFNLADFVPFLAPLDFQGLTRRMKATSKLADEIIESIIDDHLKEDSFEGEKDILGVMLGLMNNANNGFLTSFDRDNVKGILVDLFSAGIDTSTVTTTWALAALLKHPRVMKLIQDELDTVVGRERMVNEMDLPNLTYLDMVVKETFRLYPPVPLLLPRESLDNVVVDGYMIPQNSRIIINFWAIGRDPNIWSENVEEFWPERFVEREVDIRGSNSEFLPFGAGRRGCPGLHLGLVTVKILLAQLVHCFSWEFVDKMEPERIDMREKFGLMMRRASKLLAIPSYRLQCMNIDDD